MRKILIFRYLFLALSVAIMVYIFSMSCQTAAVSNQSSGKVIRTIAKIIIEDFESKPIEYQINFISSLQFFVRKSAHFLIYFMLGVSFCGFALTFDKMTVLFKSFLSFGFSVLYAVGDEIHQLFVSGRSGQISDVILDACGIICGVLFINLAFFVARKLYCRFSVRGKASEQ